MKKLLSFALVLVIGLSCISISYAGVRKLEQLNPYKGVWIAELNEVIYYIVIGNNYNLGWGVCLSSYSLSDASYKSEYYYLTYDDSNNSWYLTNSSDDISYRMKIEDNSLNMYVLYNNRLYFSAKKLY